MVKFGEIAREVRSVWKESREGVPVVGLEHIVPGEMELKQYDLPEENTFTKKFCKGQILFGRRRAYQKKATVATFDGICSGDITVIEPIPGRIVPELLPFIIANDRFFDHAIKGSAGSLSPRVKWEHMSNYELELPSLDEQKILAEKLWAAYRLKEAYQRLLSATDEMVKSQFLEMFGNVSYLVKLGDVARVVPGKTLPLSVENEGGEIAYVKVADFNLKGNERELKNSSRFVSQKTSQMSVVIPKGSTIFAKNGAAALSNKKRITTIEACIDMNTMAVYPTSCVLHPEYLYAYCCSKDLAKMTLVGAIPQIRPKELMEMEMPLPSMELQEQLAAMVRQADKSKYYELN